MRDSSASASREPKRRAFSRPRRARADSAFLIGVLSVLTVISSAASTPAAERAVRESARGIPIVKEADVVVAGGSTGAVAAAVAAARAGAKVYLAAPFPYLGDDMTATLRLWLEDGEVPESLLGKAIFSERRQVETPIDPSRRLKFTYAASLPSSGAHKDASPPSLLADGRWATAVKESVQYDGDVEVSIRLEKEADVDSVLVFFFHANDFLLESAAVKRSLDGGRWEEGGSATVAAPPQASVSEPALKLSVPVGARAKYLEVSVKKAAASTRLLIGEIAVLGPPKAGAEAPREPRPFARPLHVKKVLDDALLEAGVEFVYSSYVTDVLRGAKGEPAGVVIANRAGRQAVLAKVIIDATDRAWVAELAGAGSEPFPAGPRTLKRVVIGGSPRSGGGIAARTIDPPFVEAGRSYDIIEYTLTVPMKDAGFSSWALAEQAARDATYSSGQQFTSDALFEVPPDPIRCEAKASGPWAGAESLDLKAFRPAGVQRLFILGGRAGVSRAQAKELSRPLALIDLGSRLGAAAAREASSTPAAAGVKLAGAPAPADASGDVREVLKGLRPVQELPVVPQEERALPVLGEYDVVVVGGGTSGAPAGIAAARQGARTLVIEYLRGLGGVGTQGAISKYYWGKRAGFSAEVEGGESWPIEEKAEWWRRTLLRASPATHHSGASPQSAEKLRGKTASSAGADIWFGAMGCGAYVKDDRVAGVIVATPQGRGVVLAKVVIDATGNADIAAAAGAPCYYTDEADVAQQGTGLPPRRLGESYTNTDFTIVDETDMVDVWSVFVYAKHKAGDAFDLGQLIDTRERRRIVGDLTVTILDQVNGRTYPDTVAEAYSDFDTHGYTVDPYFTLEHPPHQKGFLTRIPFRALLPKGLDGILVTGLGISVHRDAVPLVRMQPDVQNLGYAAGLAAAVAAKSDASLRALDVRALQKQLVQVGNLSKDVLTQEDSYPLPLERVAAAVEAAGDGYKDISVILARPDAALPLLRKAHAAASSRESKLTYAHILAVLGDPSGVLDLLAAVEAAPGLDEGWRYTGMGQYGPNMSRLDRLIYALGSTRDRRATGAIVAKLKLLEPEDAFSHFRAMALALERLGDPAAAEPLADLLSRPGIGGHATTTIQGAIQEARKWPSWNATEPRSNAIRELILSRALFLCGDKDGLARKTLEAYTKDLRGHLSRHAQAILQSRRKLD